MKKLEVIYLRKAQEDIDDITYYIAQDNLEAAVAFFEAVESTLCHALHHARHRKREGFSESSLCRFAHVPCQEV